MSFDGQYEYLIPRDLLKRIGNLLCEFHKNSEELEDIYTEIFTNFNIGDLQEEFESNLEDS